ncbi:MAG TPA: glycosyltransferase [Pyrinomonadaceae bacterium]|jgi:glycosyltransferase involved in cell wall biosynthesis
MSEVGSGELYPKVVRIIARLNVGGPARHVVWLNAGLERQGWKTLLVTGRVPPGEDDMSYFAAENGVAPLVIPQMSREISPKDIMTVWKLYRLFLRWQPDIVHTHTAKAGTVGRLAGLLYRWLTPGSLLGRKRACLFVHTYHGHIFHSYYGRLKTRLFLAIEKVLARLATDRIIAISPQQYREIHEEFGVGREQQFAVIPLGLDTGVFAGWPARRELARHGLGLNETDVAVGIIGRLTEIKNHTLFLKSVARYKELYGAGKEGRRVRFIIIGDGHLRAGLEAEARELGVHGDVIFTGTRSDLEKLYPALDVVALTSLNEGTPLTLIEAMANARAVVAVGVGGVVDLLGEQNDSVLAASGSIGYTLRERGVLVEPNNAEAFARALAYLIENENLRREMGLRGQHFVESSYSKERLLKDVTSLYREMLLSGKSRAGVIPGAEAAGSEEGLHANGEVRASDSAGLGMKGKLL